MYGIEKELGKLSATTGKLWHLQFLHVRCGGGSNDISITETHRD